MTRGSPPAPQPPKRRDQPMTWDDDRWDGDWDDRTGHPARERRTPLTDEPDNGALVAYLMPDGEIDVVQPVYIRYDRAAEEGGYGERRWYPVGKVDDE